MTITNDPQQQQPPPSASENWAMKIAKAKEAREAGRIMRSAPSTGATAGGDQLHAMWRRVQGSHDHTKPWYPLSEQEVLTLFAEVAQLRSERDESLDLCARGAAEIIALRSDVAERDRTIQTFVKAAQHEANVRDTLRSDLAHAQADVQRGYQWQQGYADRLVESQTQCDQLRAQLAARDSQLATLQAVVEAARQVVSPTALSRMSALWALSDALAAFDQVQQQQQQEVPD